MFTLILWPIFISTESARLSSNQTPKTNVIKSQQKVVITEYYNEVRTRAANQRHKSISCNINSQKRKPITETSSLLLTVTEAREPIHTHPGLTIRRDRRFIEEILEGAVTMNFARK